MVRLTTIGNVFSGIGIAFLGFAIGLKYLLESLGTTGDPLQYPFFVWLASLVLLGIVLLVSIVNTFTEMTGFVHPDDKLYANTLVFIMTLGTILTFGLLEGFDTTEIQGSLFNMGTMIVIAYIFLFIFVFFGSRISSGADTGQIKEMTSRFMLVSLILGAIMAGVNFALNWIWLFTASYAWAAGTLFLFAIALVFVIVFFLGRRYEPVGE
ncbi:MAG: hypothetical protein RTV41_07785 [Candidatus Thorarchaeota archaeon]